MPTDNDQDLAPVSAESAEATDAAEPITTEPVEEETSATAETTDAAEPITAEPVEELLSRSRRNPSKRKPQRPRMSLPPT